jgi:PPK2 family polyphosphate:nucleotide phosphotransferase
MKIDIERVEKFIAPYRVSSGRAFQLKRHATRAEDPINPEMAEELLRKARKRLSALQERLHAAGTWSLLLIFQGMDAAGKDGAIKNVMSGVDPQGVDVVSFKAPAGAELEHDFLWRTHQQMPRRGRIGIFNRSYYEEVVAVRVYPHYLDAQRLPPTCRPRGIWDERIADIAAHEDYLARNGTIIRKVFLNISRAEQKSRLLARIADPDKMWKFSPDDLRDRAQWPHFMSAYEAAIKGTATKAAPWFVVPADDKPFARLVVAAIAIAALEELDLAFPTVGPAQQKIARAAAQRLAAESNGKKNGTAKRA